MKQLVVGKTGALKASPAQAVRVQMQKRVGEGKLETPDDATRGVVSTVTVKVHAPKVDAFLEGRKKTLQSG